jgi:hypothetical protein
MKTCSKCKIEKSFDSFVRDKRQKSGLHSWCKKCCTEKKVADYKNDPEKFRARKRLAYPVQRESILKRDKARRPEANARRRERYATDLEYKNKCKELLKTDAHREHMKRWRESNSARTSFHCSNRRSLRLSATPQWLTAIHKAQIQEMYDVAKALTVQSGVNHQVDHIHPLRGKNFSGMHVPWNLQVITAAENRSKRNNLPSEDQHLGWGV